MFWDPYFGWDTHMIRSCFFGVVMLAAFASFISATEGLGWAYPYLTIYNWVISHTEEVLISTIILLIGGFYYWKAQVVGDF